MFSIKEILDLAIRLEKNGEATYRQALRNSSDAGLKSALAWMADEEARHGRWFSELKSALEKGKPNPFLEEMSHQLFDELVGNQSFSLKEVNFEQVASLEELVAIFIEFEKDTVLFYEMILPFIEDRQTRAHLESVIAEENRHIERLQEFKPQSAAEGLPQR